MASTYSDLKIQLMATGENSGTWGEITNTNLGTAIEEAITGSANVAFSSADVTLTLTNTNETQAARNLRLNLTGTSGGNRNLIVPAIEKIYIINNGLANQVTVKNATGTGIVVPAGKTMYVYNNGTNVVDAITHLTSLTLGSALPVASGGTGVTTSTGTGAVVLSTSPTLVTPVLGTPSSGTLTNATGLPIVNGTTGTLSVARGGTGATTLTGVLKGNGTSAVTASNVNLASEVTGTLPVANGGTGITSFGTGVATFLGTPSSANLAAAVTDETGTGALVFASSPALAGVPTTPTAAAGTNTTQVASTAHVFAERTNTATLTNKTLTSPAITTPTGIVKGDVGLGNVDNTSDATKNSATATLTNKTLTSPSISSPTVTGDLSIEDKIVHTGDTNTAIRFPAADTVTVETNGAERVRVTSAGNVGIGTASPITFTNQTSVSVNGTTASRADLLVGGIHTAEFSATSTQTAIGSIANIPVLFVTQNGEKMRIDASGNVGIGTTGPGAALSIARTGTADLELNSTSSGSSELIQRGSGSSVARHVFTAGGQTAFVNSFDIQQASGGEAILQNRANAAIRLFTNDTERARIDASGNLLVGTTSGGFYDSKQHISAPNCLDITNTAAAAVGIGIAIRRTDGAGGEAMRFVTNTTIVGFINTTASATSYLTSSDYRLKENVAPMQNALATVAQLKPCTYKWKVDGSAGQGFIAHELQAIVPDAVTGEKDAVDKDGKPKHQGVDTSFLVATLTAALQELSAKVDTLQAELNTLKGN